MTHKAFLTDDRITVDGLLFQLFYRDQLTPRDIKDIEDEPDETKQKESLVRIINWMIEHNDWETMASEQKLSRKMKEWKNDEEKTRRWRCSSIPIKCRVGGIKCHFSRITGSRKGSSKGSNKCHDRNLISDLLIYV